MGDYAPTKLEKRCARTRPALPLRAHTVLTRPIGAASASLDEASGSAVYSLSFRVKRTRAAAAADEMPLQA